MSEGPIPNNWREAAPIIVWSVLVSPFGLLLIESLGQLFKDPFSRAIFALCGLVGVLAMLICRRWLLERFKSLSGGSVVAAIVAVLFVLALSPYVEQQRWPFKHWLTATSAPSADEVAEAVVHKFPKTNMPIPAMIASPATALSFVSPIHEKSIKWDIVQGIRISIIRGGLNPECRVTIVRESDAYAKDYDADFREILDVLNWSVKDGDERIGPVEKEMTIRAINYGPSKDCAEALAVRIRNVGRTRKGSSLNSLIQLFDETSAPSYIKQCVSACIEVDFGLEDTTR